MNTSPQVVGGKEYRQLLEKLLAQGTGYALKEEIVVIPSSDPDRVYVTEDIAAGFELLRRGEQPPQGDPAFKFRKKNIVDFVYEPADPANPGNGHKKPKPSQHRIVLPINEETSIPVAWTASFTIPEGGYLMVQQRHVEALSKALDDIRNGIATEDDALLAPNGTLSRIAKFDVYGFPLTDLAAEGYEPVELDDSTKAITARIAGIFNAETQAAAAKAAADAAYAALPFTRKSSNFVGDHTAPERASFKKRTKSLTLV